ISKRGVRIIQAPELLTRKYTQNEIGQSLHRVLHLVQHRTLQAHEVARKHIIDNLPAAVRQGAVTKRPSRQDGVEMLRPAALHHQSGPAVDVELIGFETAHEIELVGRKVAKDRHRTKWAPLAGSSSPCH